MAFGFLIAALVLFILAAVPLTEPHNHRLVAAGLACYMISLLFGGR